jgi:hypothetical protein
MLCFPAPEGKRGVCSESRSSGALEPGATPQKQKGQLKTHVEHRTTPFASRTLHVYAVKLLSVHRSRLERLKRLKRRFEPAHMT